MRGGNSSPGDVARRGDTENVDPQSDISDGGPSSDSARDVSDTDGEGSGPSTTP